MTMSPPSLRDAQDASFFRMAPFDGLSLEVLGEAAPTGVVIGGAKRWDPSLEASYPVVAAIKGVRPHPTGFLLKRYGNVLVRNVSSGSLTVRQAWSDEGKMPLYVPPSQDDSTTEVEEMESTIVIQEWVVLGAEHAQVPPSDLEITLMFGDVLSNSVMVSTGSPGLRWEETVGWHAARSPLTPAERVDPRFAPDVACPAPAAAGIAWELLAEHDHRHGRWPLALGFCVRESDVQAGALRIPLHLVFAWLASDQALHVELQVPVERTRVEAGLRRGSVLLDVHPLFQDPRGGEEIVPNHLHLLAICGSVRQGPEPLPVGIAPSV
ncbi:MAG TPA: hypothetical protein PKO15_01385 [Fibrobacteria bacterium]|nr:hypothetical protein [Fibrobacteria bacterium]HOX50390.1 hypothetical protein [Fibrobacteria bacterium]